MASLIMTITVLTRHTLETDDAFTQLFCKHRPVDAVHLFSHFEIMFDTCWKHTTETFLKKGGGGWQHTPSVIWTLEASTFRKLSVMKKQQKTLTSHALLYSIFWGSVAHFIFDACTVRTPDMKRNHLPSVPQQQSTRTRTCILRKVWLIHSFLKPRLNRLNLCSLHSVEDAGERVFMIQITVQGPTMSKRPVLLCFCIPWCRSGSHTVCSSILLPPSFPGSKRSHPCHP